MFCQLHILASLRSMSSMFDTLTSSTVGAFLLLLLAATLEVVGDSFFQSGLRQTAGLARTLLFVTGAGALILYGVLVNLPRWNFGKLLGVYIAFFFLAAQIVAWLRFREIPTPRILFGGSFILVGGLIIGLGRIS
jgi:drug/metabolite transporter (DMT)-like permease